MNIPQLLSFLALQCFQIHTNFLAGLHIFAFGDVLIVEDVDVSDSFGLEITVELLAPFIEEGIACSKKFVGFFLCLEFAFD